MFNRPNHQHIQKVLESLDGAILARYGCYFGGGTAIVLMRNEYRESVDIDLMVSEIEGYKAVRELVTGPKGLNSIAKEGASLTCAREIKVDRDKIFTLVESCDAKFKFEIVLEGRVKFESPGVEDVICGIQTLAPVDMVTSKLLANDDRWNDDAVFNRDIIDLAMFAPDRDLLAAGKAKAYAAYGQQSIEDRLAKAAARLLGPDSDVRLKRCMEVLQMSVSRAELIQKIQAVAKGSAKRSLSPR